MQSPRMMTAARRTTILVVCKRVSWATRSQKELLVQTTSGLDQTTRIALPRRQRPAPEKARARRFYRNDIGRTVPRDAKEGEAEVP